MNIMFVTISWPPSGGRNLYTDLMDEFIQNGHNVFVVTNQDYDKHVNSFVTEENKIKVLRVSSGRIRKSGYIRKIRSLFALGAKMWKGIRQHYAEKQIDLIIGSTPPITLSGFYSKLKKHFGAPFYLLLKDIWPQGSVDLKVIRKYGIPWLYLRSHERKLYNTADYIGCMSPLGVQYLVNHNKYLPLEKVEVCPNSIRPTKENKATKNDIRKKYKIPPGACVFLFSGNLGIGHGLHFFIDALKVLSNYNKAYFVIGGSGTQYDYLKSEFQKLNPVNALLYSWLPREDYEEMLKTSDVGLIFLYRYTLPQFPSRLLSYLDYSKPVLCAVNKATDIGTIIEESGCGRSVDHGDLNEFAAAVKFFCENENKRKTMGINGKKLLMENYTVKHSYDIIVKHFNQ